MRTKSHSVALHLHPMITGLMPALDREYRMWEDELIITSGSEHTARHGYASLHYATPGQAIDVRIWSLATHSRGSVPSPKEQHTALSKVVDKYCLDQSIPRDWIEVILEKSHIHIEYQPKRPHSLNRN